MMNAHHRHDEHRGGHNDLGLPFVSNMSVPSAFRNNAATSREESEDAA
jgi:hypothetical protein